MKIPDKFLNVIKSVIDTDITSFTVDIHNDKDIAVYTKIAGYEEYYINYAFSIVDEDLIPAINIEIIMPSKLDEKFWHDNGYPTQGHSAFIRLDKILNIFDKDSIRIANTSTDLRYVNRFNCAFDHGMLTIEVATKPSITLPFRITFVGRSI